MARVKGGLFTSTLDVNKRFPLDSRMLVSKKEDLINPATWITNTLTTEATYNVMIVSVNSDGKNNGVYYLNDRTAVTEENYASYQEALTASADVTSYFSMWTRLADLDDIETLYNALSELEKKIGNSSSASLNLVPVDGSIVLSAGESGETLIGVALSKQEGNTLTCVEDGLYLPEIKIANDARGLTFVDGELNLGLATTEKDRKSVV